MTDRKCKYIFIFPKLNSALNYRRETKVCCLILWYPCMAPALGACRLDPYWMYIPCAQFPQRHHKISNVHITLVKPSSSCDGSAGWQQEWDACTLIHIMWMLGWHQREFKSENILCCALLSLLYDVLGNICTSYLTLWCIREYIYGLVQERLMQWCYVFLALTHQYVVLKLTKYVPIVTEKIYLSKFWCIFMFASKDRLAGLGQTGNQQTQKERRKNWQN